MTEQTPVQSPTPAAVRWLWFSVLVIALDQATKAWIVAHLELYQALPVAPFLDIIRTHNTGAAFSFLAGAAGWQRWLFIGLGLAVSVALPLWMRAKNPHALQAAACAFIVGGALGNVIDRVWHGHVVDFVHFHYRSFDFPAFNVADSAITLGAILLLIDLALDVRRGSKDPAPS
ncbi:MAG TPA: signal peptidase II [Steroidobacteraceae bacterium]|nr:signal peptidase II [Steroidobacteraceae bacterium]